MDRRAATLLESLVVIVIIGTLAAMLFPSVQKARALANRTACANNLRQIGLAVHTFHDAHRQLPHARLCPSPWRGGNDLFCKSLPTPAAYTGPNEVWWAPYDNRPGTDPTRELPGHQPRGILWPFLENSRKVLQCPDGEDATRGSPTSGRALQVGYTLNPAIGGKRLSDLGVPGDWAWDHTGLPNCGLESSHWESWPAGAEAVRSRHRPIRHAGMCNVVGRDAHVWGTDPRRADTP
jgi:type II secretory pathway pseudopilin PulG